ncbi:restriction endonuclease subunit S [uncultured Flavobacterium sp.]|uniref:restriction endonuclease subunit S n=1 Tax=uncultured Flavobacterium sp. TaxID=165435 RepID=UPI0030EF4C36|tara:strand:- start:5430 stop:6647 length:1218 start_codon:yes stop_codon:yes gene_type:complete
MKQGWEVKNLVDVCIVERGSSPRPIKKYQTDSSDGVNWIKIGDTKGVEKYIYTTKEKITKEGAEKSRYVKEGDLILSNSMSFGRPYIMKTDGYIHDGWFVLRLHNFIDAEYFFHLLSSPCVNEQFHKLASGSVVQNISGDLVKRVVLPIPSLHEQQLIVAILDETFDAIAKAKANAEQNLNNAKELFESYLQGVFETKGEGWENKTLKELTTLLGDGLHGTPKYTEDGDYHFINGNNLKDGVIEFKTSTKRVSIEEYNKYKKNLTDRTVMVSINGTLGNVAFYNNEKIILGKSACYFNMKDSVAKSYIKYVLSSPYFLLYAHKESTGATIKNVSLKTMREFIVPLPSLNEQQSIVRKLDALSLETKRLEAIYQQKINDLEELKKSVLQKAFAGELSSKTLELESK